MTDVTLPPRRREHDNEPTMFMRMRVPSEVPLSFRRLFTSHYRTMRRLCTGFPHPGVVIVAVGAHTGRFHGSLTVAAQPTEATTVIVGRHTHADLFLDADPGLSLRHLAVVLGPSGEGDPCVRLIDLRTRGAFEDEHGRRYESLVATGSLFVRCGDHVLFVLITGPDARWPELGGEAWERFPPRVYLESTQAEPDRQWPPPPGADVTLAARIRRGHTIGDSTMVVRIPGPVAGRRCMLAPDEEPLGTLWVTTHGATQALVVGEHAVTRGVLLGRYDRCDVDRDTLRLDDSVSRVHLLVLSIDERLYAIDTASSNGTLRVGDVTPFRIVPLAPGGELVLGRGSTRVRWQPA